MHIRCYCNLSKIVEVVFSSTFLTKTIQPPWGPYTATANFICCWASVINRIQNKCSFRRPPPHPFVQKIGWRIVQVIYRIFDSFCRTMLNLSSSLISCLGARSTIATVLNHVSLLQLSRKGGKKGESVDICRNMSMAGFIKGCKTRKRSLFLLCLMLFKTALVM